MTYVPDVPDSDLTPALRAGFPLIKIQKGIKLPFPGWPTESNTAAEITQWVADLNNVGWRLGAADLVIDIDPRNFKDGIDSFVKLFLDFDLMDLDMPHVRTPSGGHHFYLIKPTELAIREMHPDYPGIEFKTAGRQVLIPPSYNEEKELYYQWDEGEPDPSHRPNAPLDLLLFIEKTEIAGPRPGGGEMTVEQLEALLSRTPVEAFNQEQTEWFNFMSACHHATQGEGGAVFETWCQTDPMYAGDQSIKLRWDSLDPNHPNPITIQSFTAKLRELGVEMTELILQPYLDNPLPPLNELPEDEGSRVVREMNEKHCAIFNGKFRIVTDCYDSSLEREDISSSGVKDFTDYYLNQTVETAVELKSGKMVSQAVNKGTFWLSHPNRLTYTGVVFAPNEEVPDKKNLWKGFSVEPVEGDCELFLRLVREVVTDNDPAVYEYVMKWLAYLVQQPQNKAKVALVLRGDKGAGKGFFASTVGLLIRSHYLAILSSNRITGQFNGHLHTTKLLYADEAFWAGSKDSEGLLKGLITEDVCTYEAKFENVFSGRSRLNLIVSSNYEWVVPTTPGDERRFCVMDVTNAWKGNFDLFDAFKTQMIDSKSGLEALMYHLMYKIDLTGWAPWKSIPHTKGLSEQIKEGFDDVQDWLYQCLVDGIWPGAEEEWPIDSGSQFSNTGSLHADYLRYMKDLNRRTRTLNRDHFSRRLKKFMGKTNIHRVQKRIDGQQCWCLEVPCLLESRKIFDGQVKYVQSWPDTTKIESRRCLENPFDSSIYA